jgi:small subunit ribosomal protein S20
MAKITSAVKRAKQSEVSRMRNKAGKSRVLTARKKVLAAVASGNKDEATKAYSEYSSVLDKTAKKGIIPKNNASRKKSRMSASIAKMG